VCVCVCVCVCVLTLTDGINWGSGDDASVRTYDIYIYFG